MDKQVIKNNHYFIYIGTFYWTIVKESLKVSKNRAAKISFIRSEYRKFTAKADFQASFSYPSSSLHGHDGYNYNLLWLIISTQKRTLIEMKVNLSDSDDISNNGIHYGYLPERYKWCVYGK
jgi:hypothetical protein